jgi:hypothetical protein
MRITLFVTGVLVCAMLVSEPAGAGASQLRALSGRTAQGQRLKLALEEGRERVQMLRFRARLRCDNGDLLVVEESGFLPTPLRRGRFADLQFGSTDEVRFRGRLTGMSVAGRLLVRDRLRVRGRSGPRTLRCSSGWVGFNAQG